MSQLPESERPERVEQSERGERGERTAPLLAVEGLDVTFPGRAGFPPVRAVRDVSFAVDRGECLAIVGESGSGKSVTARTLVGLAGGDSAVGARRLSFRGEDLTALNEAGWRTLRGRGIGLVLQDALVSLDPLRTVASEVAEPLRVHRLAGRSEVGGAVLSLLDGVGVPDAARRARQYPHQLSGGLRQRALIASALAGGPELLVADEPTTALDVTVQAQVLDLLERLKRQGTALVVISHDLAVVSRLADRVAVMYGGLVVEQGSCEEVLTAPQHPYTQALLAAVPSASAKGTRLSITAAAGPEAGPDGCPYASRCPLADQRCRDGLPPPHAATDPGSHEAAEHDVLCWHPGRRRTGPSPSVQISEQLPARPAPAAGAASGEVLIEVDAISKRFRGPDGSWYQAVDDVSFRLHRGETLGVVGESGSGKTTAARIVLGLLEPDSGRVIFAGTEWSGLRERARRPHRRRIQAVQQDPLGSFDPRFSVERIVGEAVALTGVRRGPERRRRVTELLDQVGLSPALLDRGPRELSGGQRQRVAIARALSSTPEVIVCDEPVSALDVSIQAQILDLLAELRGELGMAMLFISHDLGVVHHVADRIAVMKDGRVVESGEVTQVFADPREPYTRELVGAIPRITRTTPIG